MKDKVMKQGKRWIAVSVALVLSFLLSQSQVIASEVDTRENALKAYEEILVNNPYEDMEGGGFTAKTFGLFDLNDDDIPELIINDEAPNIFTYQNGKAVFLYNSWVLCSMYLSEKNNYIMQAYGSKEYKSYTIYKLNDEKNNLDVVKGYAYENKNYYAYSGAKKTKLTKAKFDKEIKKYMPGKVKIKSTYENTAENRNQYLK